MCVPNELKGDTDAAALRSPLRKTGGGRGVMGALHPPLLTQEESATCCV